MSTHLEDDSEVELDSSESESESVEADEEEVDEEDGVDRFLFKGFPELSSSALSIEPSDSLDFRLA